MQFLSKLSETAKQSYRLCIKDMEARYEVDSALIEGTCTTYEALAKQNNLHLMLPNPDLKLGGWGVSGDEMRALYKNKFSKRGEPGRELYDKIKLLTPKCPLCRVGRVRELDHYLPKKTYPALAVSPSNLVPVCKDCNYDKRTKTPTCAEEVWPHPYFDDIQKDKWLNARLIQLSKPEIEFFLSQPSGWTPVEFKRLQSLFDDLELNTKYSIEAATKLVEIAGMVLDVYQEDASQGVVKYLERSAASISRTNINHWEVALYECLSTDKWYCDGGFKAFL